MLMMSIIFMMLFFGVPGLFLLALGFGLLIRFLPELLLFMIVVGLVRRICCRRGYRMYYRRYYE